MDTDHITLEFLDVLMNKIKPGRSVSSYKIEAGSGRGDNYTAMLYRVVINLSDGSCLPLILKRLPLSLERRQAFKSDVLFKNEVVFYTQALPALLSFQNENGTLNAKFTAVPKCHLAHNDLIVLEDLKARGFKMADRKKGLDINQCTFVVRELARFHGLSFAMKYKDPERFQLLVKETIKEVYFKTDNEEWYRQYYRTVCQNALLMVKEELSGIETSKYVEKFEAFVDESSFYMSMVDMVTPREPLAVLCHGDCWSNNIMFRYSNKGAILELCLVDFQLARYSSPALDLVNLLYSCTSHELRKYYMSQIMDEYCSALIRTIEELGCPKNLGFGKKPLKEMIIEEIHRCGKYGLGLALDMIPICTCDSDQAPDLYVAETPQQEQELIVEPVSTTNELCQKRIAELVQELIDNGVL